MIILFHNYTTTDATAAPMVRPPSMVRIEFMVYGYVPGGTTNCPVLTVVVDPPLGFVVVTVPIPFMIN